MSDPLQRITILFIVRVWAEYLSRDPPAFCGEIEHIASKQKQIFQNDADIHEFIRLCIQGQNSQDCH